MRDYTSVQIYGADSYVITFDEQTCTEKDKDYIFFYDGWSFLDIETVKNAIKYSGGSVASEKHFPGIGTTPPLEINASKFMFQFCTDWAGDDWGYKLTVTPKFKLDEPKVQYRKSSASILTCTLSFYVAYSYGCSIAFLVSLLDVVV